MSLSLRSWFYPFFTYSYTTSYVSLSLSLSLSLQSGIGTGFSSSASLLPSISFSQFFQTRFHLHVAPTRRTNRRSLETFRTAMLFRKFGNVRRSNTVTLTVGLLQPDACHLLVTQSMFYLHPKHVKRYKVKSSSRHCS